MFKISRIVLSWSVLVSSSVTSQQVCTSTEDSVSVWANSLSVLSKQDNDRSKLLHSPLGDQLLGPSGPEIKDRFYRVLSQPLQSYCSVSKKIGGQWLSNCGFLDGDKFVCMDKMKESVQKGDCLVYSFGLSDDWSFEEAMAGLGCTVRAFDPTVDKPDYVVDEQVVFKKLGLGVTSGTTQVLNSANRKVLVPVSTLEDVIKQYGEMDKPINYLKVDVEGSEIDAIPKWLDSGVLKNVQQIGIELHTGPINIQPDKLDGKLRKLLVALQRMDKEYGFKLVSYNPNGCVGKSTDSQKRYYSYFDIVLFKP